MTPQVKSACVRVVALFDAASSANEKMSLQGTDVTSELQAIAGRIQKRLMTRLAEYYKKEGIAVPSKHFSTLKASMLEKRLRVQVAKNVVHDFQDRCRQQLSAEEITYLDTKSPLRVLK